MRSLHRFGLVFVEGAADVTISNCTFERVGGNGLFISGRVRRLTARGNRFRKPGDTAIVTAGKFIMADGEAMM
jgi:hypothetical protein